MRFISYRFLALTALLMNASAVLSQDPGTGTPPFRSFQFGQFDQVNLSNLNATSSIPIVSIPGRGLDFSFSLYYNGLVWKMGSNGAPGGTGNGTGVQWLPNNIIDNVAVDFFGWNVYRVIPQILHTKTVRPCGVGHVTQYGNYVVIEQNGTVHSFGIRFNVPGCGGYNAPRTGYATDGSGYFVDATSPDAPIAYTPSGVKITTTGVMTDSNGNQIKSVAINSNETDWIDTLGRTALKIITTYAGNFPSQVQYQTQDSSGSWQTTTLNFLTLKVQTNFGCSQVQENGSSQGLPVSLSLPNGRQYTFAYELTPGSTSTYTGRLQRVTLPAGGSYEYDYPGANDSMDCTYGTTTNLSQVVSGGGATLTTSFLRTQTGTYTAQTTVTPTASPSDPSISNQVLYSFDHNHQIQKFIYKGVYPTATLLRTVNTTWSSVLPNGFPTTKITILEDGQTQSEVDTTYDSTNFGNGNLLSENDYGFGTGVRGPLLRSKTFSYLGGTTYTSRNIQDRVTSVVISDGTGAVVARTDTTYDGSSLNPCPTGIPQHDDANYDCLFLARGNPTSVTRYLDPATPGNAIVRNMSYDIFGNVRQADMDCCTSRASNYSASTQYGYPDSQVDGPQGGLQLTRSFTYYFPVGLVASRTDPNGSTISFTYDLMNRLTNAAYPDGGNSSYSYNDSSRIRTETITIGNGVSPKSTQLYYDQLGQPVQTQLTSDPQGTDITDVTYDALGRKKTVSNPHRGFISATDGITTYVYDAFGRASQIIPPDGSSTSNNLSMTFALNCEIISDQTLRKRKLCTDPLDRLIQVFEPDASGNLVIETDYQYDALDNLTSVIQNGSRQRTFQYDALNRLTKATNPETGTIQYFYTKSDGSTCGPNPLSVCRKLDELVPGLVDLGGSRLVARYATWNC